MHFSTFITSAILTAHALAAPQLLSALGGLGGGGGGSGASTISTALDMVKTSIDGLDTAVKSINSPDPNQLLPVANKAQAVSDTIKKAQTMIDGAPMVDLIGALQLNQKAQGLSTSTTNLANDLVAKKPIVDQTGLTPVVAQMLQMQQGTSGGLIKSVTAKLPALAQGIAQGQTQGVTSALAKAVQAYSQAGNGTTTASPAAMSTGGAAASAPGNASTKYMVGFHRIRH